MEDNTFNTENESSKNSDDIQTSQIESDQLFTAVSQMRDEISYLRDLFVRRLSEDKQKTAVIQKLSEGASYAFIEPFLYDIILLLDRLEKSDDNFALSVKEELYDIINRRGVEIIQVSREFDPALYKAVKVEENPDAETLYVSGIIRNGYTFSGKVVRPAEVTVVKPISK